MSNNNYLRDRLETQLAWYAKRASQNKRSFQLLQAVVIIAGGLIPFLNTANYLPEQIRIISSILGTIVSILTAINQFKKYESMWNEYRKTAELLKREKYLFMNNAGYYSYVKEEDRNKFLVDKVENSILA